MSSANCDMFDLLTQTSAALSFGVPNMTHEKRNGVFVAFSSNNVDAVKVVAGELKAADKFCRSDRSPVYKQGFEHLIKVALLDRY